MTNNQTIDGLPRLLLRDLIEPHSARCLKSAQDRLRALLDAPACSACNDTGQMHEPGCEPGSCTACLEKPAAQPQGEPVGWIDPICLERMGRQPERNFVVTGQRKPTYSAPLYAEQPAPVEEGHQTMLELQHELAILHDAFKLYPGGK